MIESVLISPGHDRVDKGAIAVDGTPESVLNMQISNRVANNISNYIDTSLVRIYGDTEEYSLQERVVAANTLGVDLFIAIHHNAHNKKSNGLEVFHKPGCEVSYRAAREIYYSVLRVCGEVGDYYFKNRGILENPYNFYVLRPNKIRVPAVLVECGFIDNQLEYKFVSSPVGQVCLGAGIALGILKV